MQNFIVKLTGSVLGLMLFFVGIQSAHAEGDILCSGKITGTSVLSNLNAMQLYFDQENPVPLGVVGETESGFAPSDRKFSACVAEKDDYFALGADEYLIRGWAWNSNLSFVSFYCNGPAGNYANEGISCGDYSYGVKIGANVAGMRQLSGYAWNETFGWINFYCPGGADPCGAIPYGVRMNNVTGALTGSAYTQAGVYLVFDGVTANLPGTVPVLPSWCDGKPYVCVEITPGPTNMQFGINPGSGGIGADADMKLANGEDGYQIHVFLKEADGITPLNEANYNMDAFWRSLVFSWKDTVKINQTDGLTVGSTLSAIMSPWTQGTGGVRFKPIFGRVTIGKITNSYFKKVTDGEYNLIEPIRSVSPTSNANFSLTSSLTPSVLFNNEQFLYDYGLPNIEPNDLTLLRANFSLKTNPMGIEVAKGPVYPNGVNGMALKFRPPIELTTLFANNRQDKIVAFRGVPMNFKAGATAWKSFLKDLSIRNAIVSLTLAYSESKTQEVCNGEEVVNFAFNFTKDFSGKEYLSNILSGGISNLLGTGIDLPAIASLPDYDPEAEEPQIPCDVAQGPGLYSIISFEKVLEDKSTRTVKYFGNKLPRIGGDMIVNPVATIKGNVYAPIAFTPSQGVEAAQKSGNININVIRETVNQNLANYLKTGIPKPSASGCYVNTLSPISFTGECGSENYKEFTVSSSQTAGTQTVYYFKDTNVFLRLNDAKFKTNTILIVDQGNLYIDENVYSSETGRNKLAILVMSSYGKKYAEAGNIYINSKVTNVQANIIADGSLFNYSGDISEINEFGEPVWSDYASMVNTLKKQFVLEGSLFSRNTIGGADLDQSRTGALSAVKPYLLLGTGDVIYNDGGAFTEAQRLRAQSYDLNYFRFFSLKLQTINGLPVDQFCQKTLSSEDIISIYNGESVIGENGKQCDGINSLKIYSNPDSLDGDLIPPLDQPELFALGLSDSEKYSPVLVKHVAVPDGTFIFQQVGAVKASR